MEETPIHSKEWSLSKELYNKNRNLLGVCIVLAVMLVISTLFAIVGWSEYRKCKTSHSESDNGQYFHERSDAYDYEVFLG